MELLCDRIYIIDNGKIIGEKTIGLDESVSDEVYQYTFVTNNNEKVFEMFEVLNINCEKMIDGINIVMANDKIPQLVQKIVSENILIYAINRQQRSLEQDFISMTVGSKNQIS